MHFPLFGLRNRFPSGLQTLRTFPTEEFAPSLCVSGEDGCIAFPTFFKVAETCVSSCALSLRFPFALSSPSTLTGFPFQIFTTPNCCSFQSSEHREELQCHVEEDTAERLVTKTVTNNIFISLGRCDDRMTAGVCPYRVIDRGKSGTRLSSSCAHVQMERHPEFHLGCANMGRATEDRESWMSGFSKGQWLIARDTEGENVQRCVNVDKLVSETIMSIVHALTVAESDQEVKFDQETASTAVKFTRQRKSCGELIAQCWRVDHFVKRVADECEC